MSVSTGGSLPPIPSLGETTLPAFKKGNSTMAIVGFILALIPFTSWVGFILGLIDWVRAKKEGDRAYGLAIAATIIGAIFGVLLIIVWVAIVAAAASDPSLACDYNEYWDGARCVRF
jgi:hypothetical protein